MCRNRGQDGSAAALPADKVAAANTQRRITPENMCHGCDCRRALIVNQSSAAAAAASSALSLPRARTEKGQVCSLEHTRRGGCPDLC